MISGGILRVASLGSFPKKRFPFTSSRVTFSPCAVIIPLASTCTPGSFFSWSSATALGLVAKGLGIIFYRIFFDLHRRPLDDYLGQDIGFPVQVDRLKVDVLRNGIDRKPSSYMPVTLESDQQAVGARCEISEKKGTALVRYRKLNVEVSFSGVTLTVASLMGCLLPCPPRSLLPTPLTLIWTGRRQSGSRKKASIRYIFS